MTEKLLSMAKNYKETKKKKKCAKMRICHVRSLKLFRAARAILAAVTIAGGRAANLALMAYSSEGSFAYHTCCDTGSPF
jgi:hypothetical protein